MRPALGDFKSNIDDDRVFVPQDKLWFTFSRLSAFGIGVTCLLGLSALTMRIPERIFRRNTQLLISKYSGRKVLDFQPLNHDGELQNAMYEASKTERVEFLVKKKFSHRAHVDKYEELDPIEEENRGKAMLLDEKLTYDPIWLSSSVTYNIVDEAETQAKDFVKYDSIVLIRYLSQLTEKSAMSALDESLRLCKPDGKILVMDFGLPSGRWLQRFAKRVSEGNSDEAMHYHDFGKWFNDSSKFEVVECTRGFFGAVYTICICPRKQG